MAKTRIIVVAVILVAYYLLTTGFVFETTKSTVTDHIDVPYSFAFSSYRVDLIGLSTKDDIKCAEWLTTTDKNIRIQSGYDGRMLIWGFGLSGRIAQVGDKDKRYVFVTSWNVEHDQMDSGADGGIRLFAPLHGFKDGDIVFKSGNAKVYLVTG